MNQRVFRAGSILLSMVSILFLFAVSVRAQGDKATVYKTKCAMCHGPDGSASTPMAKSLKIRDFRLPEVQKQTNAELTQIITKGKGKMPAFESKVSKEQIEQLVAYVRELGKKH